MREGGRKSVFVPANALVREKKRPKMPQQGEEENEEGREEDE